MTPFPLWPHSWEQQGQTSQWVVLSPTLIAEPPSPSHGTSPTPHPPFALISPSTKLSLHSLLPIFGCDLWPTGSTWWGLEVFGDGLGSRCVRAWLCSPLGQTSTGSGPHPGVLPGGVQCTTCTPVHTNPPHDLDFPSWRSPNPGGPWAMV